MDTLTPEPASGTELRTPTEGLFTAIRTHREWRVALLMAALAAAIYQAFVSTVLDAYIADRAGGAAVPIIAAFVTALLVMACAVVAGAYHPRAVWRWGLAVAIMPALFVALRMSFDIAFIDPALHRLFPLETMMVVFLTVPSAFIGASIGGFIGRAMGRERI